MCEAALGMRALSGGLHLDPRIEEHLRQGRSGGAVLTGIPFLGRNHCSGQRSPRNENRYNSLENGWESVDIIVLAS